MNLFDAQTNPDDPTQDYSLMDWFFYFLFGGTPGGQ
jgi:hypothetical protein